MAVAIPYAMAVLVADVGVATAVGLAFAVAASTFCPLLVLGIWWSRLTDVGAIAGLLVGGAMLLGRPALRTFLTDGDDSWVSALLSQPAAWSVPAAFLAMVVGSLLTPDRRSAHVTTFMVRLHTPEAVEVDRG